MLDQLVEEMKQILRRDFQRRMIESVAYRGFETWWASNEKLQKVNVVKDKHSVCPFTQAHM